MKYRKEILVVLGLVIAYLFTRLVGLTTIPILPVLLISFSLALFIHLINDVIGNEMPFQSYFLTYRIINNFNLKNLVYPDHYLDHLKQKKSVVLP